MLFITRTLRPTQSALFYANAFSCTGFATAHAQFANMRFLNTVGKEYLIKIKYEALICVEKERITFKFAVIRYYHGGVRQKCKE